MNNTKSKLKSHHWRAIFLLAQGYSNEAVAQELDMTARQVRNWHGWEEFEDELEKQKRQLFDSAIAACIDSTKLAAETLVDVARNSQNPNARVAAASKLLDIGKWHHENDLDRRLDKLEAEVKGLPRDYASLN